MHTGNSCHLVPKPDTPEGRFIIDASNVSEGRIPLNGVTARDQAILRYGAVHLPNILGVLHRWDVYRRQWNLQWSDLVIFKEDIKSCFNHLRWSTRSSKLLATMVDPEVVFVMLTGGFGHTSTPMQWDVVGQAILRRVESGCPPQQLFSAPVCDVGPLKSPVDMYVDDSFGAGRADHVRIARDRVVLVSVGVLAPGSAISWIRAFWHQRPIFWVITWIAPRLQFDLEIVLSTSSFLSYSALTVRSRNHWCCGNA